MRTLLAILAALLATAGLALLYAQRTVFDENGFAARTDAALRAAPVREAAARRLAGAAVSARPDLVAVQPLLESAAGAVTGTPAFRSLAVAAARDVHRAAFDRDASSVMLAVTDAGILVSEAANQLSPELAKRLPDDFDAQPGVGARRPRTGAALKATERADQVRRLWPLALLGAALLAAGAIALSRPRRAGVIRVGAALAAAAGLLALATVVVPRLAATRAPTADHDAVRAIAAVWLGAAARLVARAGARGRGRRPRGGVGRAPGLPRSRCCTRVARAARPAPSDPLCGRCAAPRRCGRRRDRAVAQHRGRRRGRRRGGAAGRSRARRADAARRAGRTGRRARAARAAPHGLRIGAAAVVLVLGALAATARSPPGTGRTPMPGRALQRRARAVRAAAERGRLRRHPQLDGGRRRAAAGCSPRRTPASTRSCTTASARC